MSTFQRAITLGLAGALACSLARADGVQGYYAGTRKVEVQDARLLEKLVASAQQCATPQCILDLGADDELRAAGELVGTVYSVAPSEFSSCEARFRESAGAGIQCFKTQLSRLVGLPQLQSAQQALSSTGSGASALVAGLVPIMRERVQRLCGAPQGDREAVFDSCVLGMLDDTVYQCKQIFADLDSANGLVQASGHLLEVCSAKFKPTNGKKTCATLFAERFDAGFKRFSRANRSLKDWGTPGTASNAEAPAVPTKPEEAASSGGGGHGAAPEKGARDMGGLGGFDASNDYLTEITRCLNTCELARDCPKGLARESLDPDFVKVCELHKNVTPVAGDFAVGPSSTDLVRDYFDTLRVTVLNDLIARYESVFREPPDLSHYPTCNRLADRLVYPPISSLPPTQLDLTGPLSPETLQGRLQTLKAAILPEIPKFCTDDPDPDKGIYWRSLAQMPALTKAVLKANPEFATVQDCVSAGLAANSRKANFLNNTVTVACLGIAVKLPRFVLGTLACNGFTYYLGDMAINNAINAYRMCWDRDPRTTGTIDVCGPDGRKRTESSLRYAQIVGRMAKLMAALNTGAIAFKTVAKAIPSEKVAQIMLELQRIEETFPPDKANEIYKRICALINLEKHSDLLGRTVATADLLNTFTGGVVQAIFDIAVTEGPR